MIYDNGDHQVLIARKNGKYICISFLHLRDSVDKEYNENSEFIDEYDLYTIYIKKEYIDEKEKEAFKEWYKKADWYGYDDEESAMKRLNTTGEFKEKVFPPEMVGIFGDIEISIENNWGIED